MERLAVRFSFDKHWWKDGDWELSPHLELGAGRWKGQRHTDSALPDSTTALIATPLVRWQRLRPWRGHMTPFLEIGIGATYIVETKLQDGSFGGRSFGGHFQFEDKASVGLLLGREQRFGLALTGYHYSNADLYHDNAGINFYTLSLRWWF